MSEDRGTVVVSARELNLSYGTLTLLSDASLTIHEYDRIGLVGRNGAGKSTLLKVISNIESPSSGEIATKKNLQIGYLPQDFELDDKMTVLENIMSGASHILDLIKDYESLAPDSARAAHLEQEITHREGWDLEQQAKVLMQSLNTPPADSVTGPLSGGEKRRVAMCKTLMSKPDFLILDEPTNHLDTESIEWLEECLNKFQGAILLVTHDRYFLDRVSTHIYDLEDGSIRYYQGNYSAYLIQKAEEEATSELIEHKRQQILKKELAWVRAEVKARTTKSKSRLQRYHDEASKDGFEKKADVDLLIPRAPLLGNKTVNLTNVSKGYGGKVLFEGLDLEFEPDTRIGIVGRNGLGKSTLVNIILGTVEPDTGTVEIGQRTQFNYVDQNRVALNPDNSVWEEVADGNEFIHIGDQKISARGYLRRFLFTDQKINTKVHRLSGGEKSRLTLAKILKDGGNFLILDEPTNDLDLATLRILEEALINFEGCVVVISHDRYFLNRVCEKTLAFEGDGKLVFQEGNYDYYLEKRKEMEKVAAVAEVVKEEVQEVKKSAGTGRKLKWKEERELEGIENKILGLEEEAEELENLFNQPDFYEKHGNEAEKLTEKLNSLKGEVEQLYKRWEELEEIKNNQ